MKLLWFLAPFVLVLAQTPAVPIDNEFVHVVMATDMPAQKPGAMHEHKLNRVMIYLDAGKIQIMHAEGKRENQFWQPGDIAWSPANGMHTSQNISKEKIRIVEIELKNAGAQEASPVAGKIKPAVDNAQVRVLRTATPPSAGHYVAVDVAHATVLWDQMPKGIGPFIVTEIK